MSGDRVSKKSKRKAGESNDSEVDLAVGPGSLEKPEKAGTRFVPRAWLQPGEGGRGAASASIWTLCSPFRTSDCGDAKAMSASVPSRRVAARGSGNGAKIAPLPVHRRCSARATCHTGLLSMSPADAPV